MIQPTAQVAGLLEILIARPQMAGLLAACPQAGRILRPLCRMLGIRPFPPALRREPVPRQSSPPASGVIPTIGLAARVQAPSLPSPVPPLPTSVFSPI